MPLQVSDRREKADTRVYISSLSLPSPGPGKIRVRSGPT